MERYEFIHYIVATFSHIRRHPESLYSRGTLPTEYISFDIETTGLSKADKITQIAAVHVKKGKIINDFDSYVNIGDFEMPTQISYLTGITPKMLAKAPSIDDVMRKFEDFIGEIPLIGHNAISFDLPKMKNAGFDFRPQFVIDTVSLAQSSPLDIGDSKLESLKLYYGIESISHNALEDAKATSVIYEHLKDRDYKNRAADPILGEALKSLSFCYTGTFRNYSRASLENKIVISGGKVTKTVTKNTDYLIVGTQIATNLAGGTKSSKELKAQEVH